MINEIHESIDVVVFPNINEQHEENQANEMNISLSIGRIPEYQLNARPLYSIEREHLRSIRHLLKQKNRLLLNTYKSNCMYSCSIDEWQTEISKFMEATKSYHCIEGIDPTDSTYLEQYRDEFMDKINTIVPDIQMQRKLLKLKRSFIRFDRLYFVPDTRQVNIKQTFFSIFHHFF